MANVVGYVTYLMHAYGETYVWLNPTILFACWLGSCGAYRVLRESDHWRGGSALEDSLDPPYTTLEEAVTS